MSRGGILARFISPGSRGFELSFCSGRRDSPIKKVPEVLPGGWSCLALTDALIVCDPHMK